MKNKFAEKFKDLRLERKLMQKEVAKLLCVSPRTVSFWEDGSRECDFDTLIKIAKLFGVSVDFLLGLSEY